MIIYLIYLQYSWQANDKNVLLYTLDKPVKVEVIGQIQQFKDIKESTMVKHCATIQVFSNNFNLKISFIPCLTWK